MAKQSEIQLRDGRQAEILRLSVLSEDIMEHVRKWFANKGPWMWHLEQWHAGLTPGMEAHFYLARLEGRLVGNVTVFRNGAFGAIYHVFTPDFPVSFCGVGIIGHRLCL